MFGRDIRVFFVRSDWTQVGNKFLVTNLIIRRITLIIRAQLQASVAAIYWAYQDWSLK